MATAVDPLASTFTWERLHEALQRHEFGERETLIIMWQFRMLGGFKAALFEAIRLADPENLERLARGFPEEVAAFKEWRDGDMGGRLRQKGVPV